MWIKQRDAKSVQIKKDKFKYDAETIKTDVPLRVFDIMGSGRFLLTNYQQGLSDYFEPNKDFVYYEDMIDQLILQIIIYYMMTRGLK